MQKNIKMPIRNMVKSKSFSNAIYLIIIVNAILIGVETFYSAPWVSMVQNIILGIFVIELGMRWIAKDSVKSYFKDPWNYFDVFVVAISFVPSSGPLSVFRALRILRILRAVKAIPELRLITNVLLKSLTSLSYTGIFFALFIYIYGVMGVMLFKAKDYVGSAYELANGGYPDPYGSLAEAYFTLFRILTGEDWTDLRYHLLEFSDYSSFIITTYHVSWMMLSGFLLINLVIGAVINNYDQVMEEQKSDEAAKIKNNIDVELIK